MSASVPPPGFVPPPSVGDAAPVDQPSPMTPAPPGRRPPRRSLVAAGLAVVAAVAAVFVLFGSSSNPAVDPIAQAATVSSHAPGFRMTMSISMTSPAFNGGPITVNGDAVVDPRDHAASMSLAMDFSSLPQVAQILGGTTIPIDMVIDGQVMYMKLPQALLSALPSLGQKPWVKMDLGKAGIPGLSSLGNDPATSNPGQVLDYLRGASDGITKEGQQRVDGVQTTHYHAELSLDHLPANVPSAERSAVQQALSKLRESTGSSDVPVDVWIDAHELIRRMTMSLSLRSTSGPTLQETMVADVTDYGPQPRPAVPPADQVQDAPGLLSGVHVSG